MKIGNPLSVHSRKPGNPPLLALDALALRLGLAFESVTLGLFLVEAKLLAELRFARDNQPRDDDRNL